MADVPIGAFLSGGIDSTTTVAIMQALSSSPVRTFTIGVPDVELDESVPAREIAKHLGTSHTELLVTPQETLQVIPRLQELYCEPFADPSQVPTFLVSQLARRDVAVSLSGDGGDELFGGYDRYRWGRGVAAVPASVRRIARVALRALPPEAWSMMLAPVARLLPPELRHRDRADRLRKLEAVLGAPSRDALYARIVSYWPEERTPVVDAPSRATAFSQSLSGPEDFTARMMLMDLRTYLPDDILVKVDRAAMAVSLETRVPLLDHRVVEFALSLPAHHRMRDGRSKWLLRQLLDRYVPRRLMDRQKKGFGIPIHAWLRGPLRPWAEDLLSSDRLGRAGILDPKPIRRLWEQHLSGGDWGYHLWPVLMFEAWRDSQVLAGSRGAT